MPTFESCSIYLESTQAVPSPESLRLEYREHEQSPWQLAHRLVNSSNDPTLRGSLLGLRENTRYLTRLLTSDGRVLAAGEFRTWSSARPIARTIDLSDRSAEDAAKSIRLTQCGVADGWVRYIGNPSKPIDAGDESEDAILIEDASYLILENMVIRGGRRNGIRVRNSQNIVIRNCDISGYGRVGVQRLDLDGKYYDADGRAINLDSGICIDRSGQLVIEHNTIHDPRSTANSWGHSHPAGPNALFVRATGQLVVRYNDLIGSNVHRWNDVIEGFGNGDVDGGFNKDADIHGNFLAFSNDDGIELDGGQCNVRFWGNKIEGTFCGVSTAANTRGPSYIFKNVITHLGDERGAVGVGIKNGGGTTYSKGLTFLYNNTFFHARHAFAAVGYGKDANGGMYFGVSRNNLFVVDGNGIDDPFAPAPNDYDFDHFSSLDAAPGRYAIARPMELHATLGPHGLINPNMGDFCLIANSPANSGGQHIDGFVSPHVPAPQQARGAWQSGDPPVFPLRNTGVHPDKQRLVFELIDAPPPIGPQSVALDLQQLAQPTTYRILKNSAFPWLSVTPAAGTITPGQALSLQVAIDAALLQQPFGILPGAFVIKLENAQSVPITVYVRDRRREFQAMVRAQDCQGAEDFASEPSELFPNTRKLWLESNEDHKPGSRGLTWEIQAPHAGDSYYVYLHVSNPEPGRLHDSAFFSVNDEPPQQIDIPPSAAWHWVGVVLKSSRFRLNQGVNRIRIFPRESLWIDRLAVRSQPLFAGESFDLSPQSQVNFVAPSSVTSEVSRPPSVQSHE